MKSETSVYHLIIYLILTAITTHYIRQWQRRLLYFLLITHSSCFTHSALHDQYTVRNISCMITQFYKCIFQLLSVLVHLASTYAHGCSFLFIMSFYFTHWCDIELSGLTPVGYQQQHALAECYQN